MRLNGILTFRDEKMFKLFKKLKKGLLAAPGGGCTVIPTTAHSPNVVHGRTRLYLQL